jgi:anti-anti-sigma factor
MTITLRRRRGRQTVVVVSGDVGAAAVPSLRRALAKALRTRAPVLVDLTQATSIHRSGAAALATAHQQAERAGTSLLLRTEPTQIRAVLAAFGIPSEGPTDRSSA